MYIAAFTHALNWSALAIYAILLVAVLMGGHLKQPVFRWFFCITLVSLIGIFSDMVVELLGGTPGLAAHIACRVLDTVSYAMAGLWFFAFAAYLYEYLRMKTAVSPKVFGLMLFYGAAAVLLAVVAQFTGLYSRFDEMNHYQQQPTFWVSQVFPIISFLTCIAVTLRHIRVLKPKEWVPLLMFPVAPIACYVLEIMHPQLWVAYFGSALTTLLIYVTLHTELHSQLARQGAELRGRLARQEAELAEARISIMLSQIHPHFLYNSLSAISELYHGTPEAQKALRTFSGYLRANMKSLTQREPVDFEEELAHVRHYLTLEKLRFEQRLDVVYDIGVTGFKLPVLTVQPIVENAVYHGITQDYERGTVTIRTWETQQAHCITVTDDGVGFDTAAPLPRDGETHVGIANVRARLAALCGGTLAIQSTPGQGTVATITIPKGGTQA